MSRTSAVVPIFRNVATSDMFESPTMTCSRRYRSASACGSSRVLMIEREDVVALGGGVLRVEPGVQVQAGAVLQEHVGVAGARDDFLEQVPRDVVGRESTLTVQRAGEAVLVLEAEDPALHAMPSVARTTSPCPGVGSAPPAGCGGTCGAPCCGRARRPPDRARS